MGIFSEIKKLFFVTTSVGKSAAEKGFDKAKDAGEEIMHKGAELGESALDKAGDIGTDILEKGVEFGSKVKHKAEDFGDDLIEKGSDIGEKAFHRAGEIGGDLLDKAGHLGENLVDKTSTLRDAILHSAEGTLNMVNKNETLKKAAAATESFGEKVFRGGEDLLEKGGDAVEALGGKILGENNENLEKAKQFTEKLGEKVLKTKDNIVDKAEDILEDINEKIDATLKKAKAEEAKEAATPPPKPFHENIRDKKNESLLDGKDDFFAKAEKFAKGDYEGVQEGRITIDEKTHKVEKKITKAAGFTDLDGDGNEVVDDAIIEVEDKVAGQIAEMGQMIDEAAEAYDDKIKPLEVDDSITLNPEDPNPAETKLPGDDPVKTT